MQEILQDLEFYEKQSMLDNCEINRLRCELQTSIDKVEKERADSWARIVGLASVGAVAASTMTLGTAASGAGTIAAVGSSTAMFGASAAFTSAATATTAAAAATSSAAVTASSAMIGTGAAMGVAAETAAVGAALSCVIS